MLEHAAPAPHGLERRSEAARTSSLAARSQANRASVKPASRDQRAQGG